MARPRQVSDVDILRVARTVFVDNGPSAPTQLIADKVGLSQPALFKRFGTKAELMRRALLPPHTPQWVVLAERGPRLDVSGREQLLQIVRQLDAFLSEYMPCFATLRASELAAQPLSTPPEVPVAVRGQGALAAWLHRAGELGLLRRTDACSVATCLMGAIQGRVMLDHLFRIPSTDNDVDTVFDVLWSGLEPGVDA